MQTAPVATHHCPDEPGTAVLEIASLSNGPDAVARHEGRVVFVPGVAPGDRVRVRLVVRRSSYARADLVHRCASGPAYREPPCPWVTACGGCPWQQVVYAKQLEAKARNVREILARIGGLTAGRESAIIPAPSEWEYRHRIRLHVGARGTLGYRRLRSHESVEIGSCAVADPRITALLAPLREVVPMLATRLSTIEIMTNGRGQLVLHAVARGRYHSDDEGRLARFIEGSPALAGMRVRGEGWERVLGDPRVTVTPEPGTTPITQRAGSFTQVNPAANQLLVRAVVAAAAPATRILDLFCGAGNLALPLARAGADVTGVDLDPLAIADARSSAVAAGLTRAHFEALSADRFLSRMGLAGADLVVLDPPRGGAPAVVTQLGRLRPRRILYVSCDPATLARDVRALAAVGYTLVHVQPVDLFPQTPHIEVVCEAALTT